MVNFHKCSRHRVGGSQHCHSLASHVPCSCNRIERQVVTAANPQSASSRNRMVESGKIDAELLNLILPACVTVSLETGDLAVDPEMLVGFLG